MLRQFAAEREAAKQRILQFGGGAATPRAGAAAAAAAQDAVARGEAGYEADAEAA
jgi:hypothetical protein